jgi:hypothetical protein
VNLKPLRSVGGVQSDLNAMLKEGWDFPVDDSAENKDRMLDAGEPKLQRFSGRTDTKAGDAAARRVMSEGDRTMSVRICFDDKHRPDAMTCTLTDRGEIVAEGIEVDLGPNTVGIHRPRVRLRSRRSNDG